MRGRLIAVVGPSGAGKDVVIDGLLKERPGLILARRAITRPADASEPFESVTEAEFQRRRDAGDFVLHWRVHGLCYGIPAETLERVRGGGEVIANLSRGMVARAGEIYPALTVLRISAGPATLAARLAKRGREAKEDMERRLSRPVPPMPKDVDVHAIANDGALRDAVAAAQAALG